MKTAHPHLPFVARATALRVLVRLTLFLPLSIFAKVAEGFDPIGLFLTWQRDPTTTMTIDWHLAPDEEGPKVLQYRAAGEDFWKEEDGAAHPFPFSERQIVRVELTGLEPGMDYEFQFGEDSRRFSFHTMPADASEPIRYVIGGDTRHSQMLMERMNSQALRYDPSFIVFGGDLAYANGQKENIALWYEWFDAVKNTLITEAGRVVPILVIPGNHEVLGGYYTSHEDYEPTDEWRHRIAPFFHGGLFAFPGQPGYGVLDFGDYLTLILLDSGHANPILGEQTDWLREVLAERKDRQRIIPVYHTPAYPSVRPFDMWYSEQVRSEWLPLFEEAGVKIAFENHDHAYKRTHPIRAGRIDPEGIVFIGDGSWGVEVRPPHPVEEMWYLKRAEAVHQGVVATIHDLFEHYLVFSSVGEVVDELPATPKPVFEDLWGDTILGKLQTQVDKKHDHADRFSEAQWQPLDLTDQANRSLHSGENPWIGAPLLHLDPGKHEFHGVPFQIINEASNRNRGVVALRSQQVKVDFDGEALPQKVSVAVNEEVAAVYLLHGTGWVDASVEIGAYRFVYEDGTVEVLPVVPLARPSPETWDAEVARANLQDWWVGFTHFDRSGVRPLPLFDKKNPAVLQRFVYSIEWVNPHPDKALKRIELTSNPEEAAAVLVLAITVALAE